MSNFTQNTSKYTKLKDFVVWTKDKNDRLSSVHAEALFFLFFWNRMKEKNQEFYAWWTKNKIDFYMSYDNKLLFIDHELTGSFNVNNKAESEKNFNFMNSFYKKKNIKNENAIFSKHNYNKVILRKFVKSIENKTLLDLLNKSYQKNEFRKELINWDFDKFGDYYEWKNIFLNKTNQTFINSSEFVKESKKDNQILFETKLKDEIIKLYNNKYSEFDDYFEKMFWKNKKDLKSKEYYLVRSFITLWTSEKYINILKEQNFLILLSDWIDFYIKETEKLDNSIGKISYNELLNKFEKKEDIIKNIKKMDKIWEKFDTVVIDMDYFIKNIKNLDFIYEKTYNEKEDLTWKTISDIDYNKTDFAYRIYLSPKYKIWWMFQKWINIEYTENSKKYISYAIKS